MGALCFVHIIYSMQSLALISHSDSHELDIHYPKFIIGLGFISIILKYFCLFLIGTTIFEHKTKFCPLSKEKRKEMLFDLFFSLRFWIRTADFREYNENCVSYGITFCCANSSNVSILYTNLCMVWCSYKYIVQYYDVCFFNCTMYYHLIFLLLINYRN